MTPLTRIEDAPLVCDITWTARILNVSVRTIERALAEGVMQPPPLPSLLPGRSHQPRQWSRDSLQAYLAGGYLAFVQEARQRRVNAPRSRKYFQSTSALREVLAR